jgi:hypothetical protein
MHQWLANKAPAPTPASTPSANSTSSNNLTEILRRYGRPSWRANASRPASLMRRRTTVADFGLPLTGTRSVIASPQRAKWRSAATLQPQLSINGTVQPFAASESNLRACCSLFVNVMTAHNNSTTGSHHLVEARRASLQGPPTRLPTETAAHPGSCLRGVLPRGLPPSPPRDG